MLSSETVSICGELVSQVVRFVQFIDDFEVQQKEFVALQDLFSKVRDFHCICELQESSAEPILVP